MGPALQWSTMGPLSDPWSRFLIKWAKWSHNYKRPKLVLSALELGNPVLTSFSLADPPSFHFIDIDKEHTNHKNLEFYSIKHRF